MKECPGVERDFTGSIWVLARVWWVILAAELLRVLTTVYWVLVKGCWVLMSVSLGC
jgi:hypothetical protein